MKLKEFIKSFVASKFKFALTSTIATGFDHGIFIYLINSTNLIESHAHLISYPIGVMTNIILQRLFIFELKRKLHNAFILAILFSIIGYLGGTFLIHLFAKIDFFASNRYFNKLVVTAIIFFYNFYTKRFAFENEIKKL